MVAFLYVCSLQIWTVFQNSNVSSATCSKLSMLLSQKRLTNKTAVLESTVVKTDTLTQRIRLNPNLVSDKPLPAFPWGRYYLPHLKHREATLLLEQDGSNYKSRTTVINESGLFALIFGSNLPSTKRFKRRVTSEVLPSIRKTGTYEAPKDPMEIMRLHLYPSNFFLPFKSIVI